MARVRPEHVRVIGERLEGARPRWRGRIHLLAALCVPAVAVPFVVRAEPGTPRAGVAVFLLSLLTLFATSAAYHRVDWSPTWALRMKRADHVAIFVLLAGTYTPFALLVLDGWQRLAVLGISWGAVAVAVAAAALGLFERRGVALSAYLTLGWMAVLMAPRMVDRLTGVEIGLVLAGGVVYTTGAIGLARRWPNPDPEHFGFHEVWHLQTVVAAALHAGAIWSLTG